MKKNQIVVFRFLLLVPLLFSFIACTAVLSGKSFDYKSVSKIERGISTEQGIRKIFGEPFTVRQIKTGEVWNYYVSEAGPVFNPTYSLDIYFDKSGTVTDYTYKEKKHIF